MYSVPVRYSLSLYFLPTPTPHQLFPGEERAQIPDTAGGGAGKLWPSCGAEVGSEEQEVWSAPKWVCDFSFSLCLTPTMFVRPVNTLSRTFALRRCPRLLFNTHNCCEVSALRGRGALSSSGAPVCACSCPCFCLSLKKK
eukprot:RCo011463